MTHGTQESAMIIIVILIQQKDIHQNQRKGYLEQGLELTGFQKQSSCILGFALLHAINHGNVP